MAIGESSFEIKETRTLPALRLNDRIAIFGRTGTGKSILAHALFRSVRIPRTEEEAESELLQFWRLCIDVMDSVYDDALTFYEPENIPWNDSYSLRFVPDPAKSMESQINLIYLECLAHGRVWVWNDELNEVSSAHRSIPGLRKTLLQGRKLQVGHCGVSPRPVDLSKNIITQSEHLFVFELNDFDDRGRLAKNFNMNRDEFDVLMSQLPEFGYLWYSVRDGTLYIMDPLPITVVETLE